MNVVSLTFDRVFAISDLHLAEGRQVPELENFVSDVELAGFIGDALPRMNGAPCSLIINGDFIHFPRIGANVAMDCRPLRVGTTEAESITKVECAIASHPEVFKALKKHLKDGNQLRGVTGQPLCRSILAWRLDDHPTRTRWCRNTAA